ncbi:MAG: bifunctional phosphoribosylaminoimidazolecarboxamide formyltransferase/IMP cyclohydrolase [Planctomycetota bacterium]
MQRKIRRALIAVSDKHGIVEFAGVLKAFGVEILSTGGTAKTLSAAGIAVRTVQDVTGFPELLGGRVKTLHPRIHGGILARREVPSDLEAVRQHDIPLIDLVVVNLYPFAQTVARGASRAESIEEIDIGGPAMIRAAAKNHDAVAVVVNPTRYAAIQAELERQDGALSGALRRALAAEAFGHTANYDATISNWFASEQAESDQRALFPTLWTEQWRKLGDLRYGENPHQQAAWYARDDGGDFSLARATVLGGNKALSYNNLLDVAAAIDSVRALNGPAAVIVKHCLPCGAAERDSLSAAFDAALAGDPLSAFGGILALSQPLDAALARRIASPELFFEVIHAPAYLSGAEAALRTGAKWGKNCRLIEGGASTVASPQVPVRELRAIPGVVLAQTRDQNLATPPSFVVVSERAPSEVEWRDLLFGWRVIPFVRSNGILLARDGAVVGVGAGQPSRVDSVHLACRKAGERARRSVLASDAFFPFADGLEAAAHAGITAAIQPGGSMRDAEVIAAANRAQLALVHTGERHFRH